MKLVMNGISLLSPITGIGRYTRSLAGELKKNNDVDLNLFYGKYTSPEIRYAPLPGVRRIKKIINRMIPRPHLFSRTVFQYRFQHAVHNLKPDLYHEPNFLLFPFSGKKVITVHDISFYRYPETHPADRIDLMNRYFQSSLDQADAIITVSNYTAQELSDIYKVPDEKIFPIYNGLDPLFSPRPRKESEQVLQRYDLRNKKFILSVGTLEPRKNLKLLMQSYLSLPEHLKNEYVLVILGMRGWKENEIIHEMETLIRQKNLIFPGYVPDEDLPAFYSSASLFVYPSIYEGFGLPPLEAMACGAPTIVSNTSSLPEVTGAGAVHVSPADIAGLNAAMRQILESGEQAEKYGKKGIRQASKFSWTKCAAQTLKVYENVLGKQ